ncbi:MAG TPA: hypothetical protein VLC95_15760 [Anaerolineae bacterium]|nr:hypothetical protein [Anaerolineae bacterium]
MDEIGRAYLRLALGIERHFEGFVDAYFGPAELRREVDKGEPRALEALVEDGEALLRQVAGGVTDAQRRDFLERQVGAMAAVAGSLAGERLDFMEEVRHYFDIIPEMVDEAVFEAAHAELDALVPGDGALVERMAAWRKGLELAEERVMPVFERARDETRRRTLALFDLPEGEELTLELVKNQPWSAYNWYLGDYRSRIEVNTDLPVRVDSAVPLMAHEAYAGHHTEHAIKEQRLYRDEGRGEHGVQLLLAPECVLSEGIADSARQMVLPDDELEAFLHDELYPLAGLPASEVARQVAIHRASEGLRGVSGNAALLLHRDGWSAEDVQAYLEKWALRTPQEAAKSLSFVQNPLFRSYVFNYALGKELIAPLLEGADAVENFRRLLSEPFTPSQVRAWVAGGATP